VEEEGDEANESKEGKQRRSLKTRSGKTRGVGEETQKAPASGRVGGEERVVGRGEKS